MQLIKKFSFVLIFLLILSAYHYCTRTEITKPEILAKVADRTITRDEFIRRAEYTIRPPYCRGANPHDKKIILNSLIAEKLLALENDTSQLVQKNSRVAAYLQGRQEQAMRQYHYYQQGFQKASVDTHRVRQAYRFAGRTYNIAYCRFNHPEIARRIMQLLEQGNLSFNEICKRIFGIEEIPQRELAFDSDMDINLFEQLFMKRIEKGKVLSPLKANDGSYVFLKVKDWKTSVAVGATQQNERYHQVRERLRVLEAERIYRTYVQRLMQGKQLDFGESVFYQLADLYQQVYLSSVKEKKKMLNQQVWNREVDLTLPDSLKGRLSNLNDQPFFTIDNKTWTVADFRRAVLSHPLIFRRDDIPPGEFANQFRLAVADLIRDEYITEDAYRKEYDKVPSVQHYRNMWLDNMLAVYARQQILRNREVSRAAENNPIILIENYLNPYIDSLQNVYDDQVHINVAALNEIQLTNIDMFVIQKRAAYPIVVPGFPLLTTDNKLDYGRKMPD